MDAQQKKEHCKCIKAAIKSAKILIKDATKFSCFKDALKSKTPIDIEALVIATKAFLADQAMKKKWLLEWLSKDNMKNIEKISLVQELDQNVDITYDMAVERVNNFENQINRRNKLKIIHTKWLEARCNLPIHKNVLRLGLKKLESFTINTKFHKYINKHLCTFDIILEEVRASSTGYKTISNLKPWERYKLHEQFEKIEDMYSFSTGLEYKRNLHIVNSTFWNSVFPVSLPMHVLKYEILQKITDEVQSKKTYKLKKTKEYNYWSSDDDEW